MIKNPTYRGPVYPWHCDHMGHMNVMWYVGKFDEASWNLFSDVGLTFSYMKENKCRVAAVEQHLTYLKELLEGETVVINSKIVEVRGKVVVFTHEMSNAVTGDMCATCELTVVHLDSVTRKAIAFPDGIFGEQSAG